MSESTFSKEQLISLLETTAQQLDRVINILKRTSPDKFPTTNTVETLVKTTKMLVEEIDSSTTFEVKFSNSHKETTPEWDELTESKAKKRSLISFNGFIESKTWWGSFLKAFRLILPSNWNNNLSDRAIVLVILGILTLILSILVLLFTRPLTPLDGNSSIIDNPEIIATSPILKSSKTPQSTEMLSSPEIRFTPEQNLIRAIQHDIFNLTNQYPESLIDSIEANFKANCLVLTLGKQWYQLTPKRQDTLADDLYKHSQKLNFCKLEIIDLQGNLIARSPVVGEKIVVFRR